MTITYQREQLSADAFAGVLIRSGLSVRRPVHDAARLTKMVEHASLIVTARDRDAGIIVGVARSLTDWAYARYLSDLAVDKAYQGRGIGRRLIDETRALAGEESMCLLIAAPGVETYYEKIGMPRLENAFMFPRGK